jgi:uncharacterized membrane protein YfcA
MHDLILLAIVGAASGFIAGLVGLAGGIVIVPALIWMYGPPALHAAIITSWFAVLFNSFGAASKQWRMRSPEERAALFEQLRWYLLGAVLVTPAVSAAASRHAGLVSNQLIAGLQLCLAAVMLYPVSEKQAVPRPNRVRDASFGGLIAGVSTLIGVGGGTYTIAYFVYGFGSRFRDAIATANVTGLAVGMFSVVGYGAAALLADTGSDAGALGPVTYTGMAILVCAGMLAAPLGVRVSRRVPVNQLRQLLIAALIVSAGRLMLS